MECPNCHTPMIVLELDQIEIDFCDGCRGIWLDAGELELLLEGAANRDELMSRLSRQVAGKERQLKCPICDKKMDKVVASVEGSGQTVRVDKCARDHGIWFDDGELHDVLQMGSDFEGNKIFDLLKDMFGRQGA